MTDQRAIEVATSAMQIANRAKEDLTRHEDRCFEASQTILREVQELRQENSAQHDTTVRRFTDSLKGVHNRIDELKGEQAAMELESTKADYETQLKLQRHGTNFYRSVLAIAGGILAYLLTQGLPWGNG